jgi:hypothetical protein
MNKFYFNTGVKPENVIKFPYEYHKEKGHVIRGTLLIPFECDAPEKAVFMYACDNPNLDSAKSTNVIVREMHNTTMVSKYAYFMI